MEHNIESVSVLNDSKKTITLTHSKATLSIQEPGKRAIQCSVKHVLWVEVEEDKTLRLSLLHRRKKRLVLGNFRGTYSTEEAERVKAWSEGLLQAAYEGSRPKRNFLVIINPFGGPGKALSVFEKLVKPIFGAAHSTFDLLVTERRGHCMEYVKTMELKYDALVVLSGDGLIHEVFNAFAAHDNSKEAFSVPVVQIPTGSGNGFSIALLGLKDGLDVGAATLNAIKGAHMKLDLCRMKQDGKEIVSFMSQTIGMMADIDLKSERLRWMGDTRFVVGYLAAAAVNRTCDMKLEIKVVARDKHAMLSTYREKRSKSLTGQSSDVSSSDTTPASSQDKDDDGEWIVIDKKLAYVCAGKLPCLSRDLMQFPVALCDDGLIDIVAQERVSRLKWLTSLDGAEKGKPYWEPSSNYFKAKAYRLTPVATDGCFSVDGERYPYSPFEVEVMHRLGSTLGDGVWHPEFIP
ncbi:hypothetical protein M422DRAFT_67694 [Sphaerobolus stellatus SS14]|uniref:DAGKc domain-containing protein n=1 Tax=Sphaerobolus stellatus (strain SS14) TaxID=990650 RepID=A0A0C9VYG4_SPHS4|nr:hypothetical protein M422DRAFT_67694 [Sphaerobolus stellatus SS14]